MSASLDLQTALHDRLAGDGAVVALLGGPRIYDNAPPRTRYPFVSFGDGAVTDHGGTDVVSFEHRLELHVWTRAGGQSDGHRIVEAVRTALGAMPGTIGAYRLANLTVSAVRTVRLRDGITHRGTLDLRAVTEPV